MQEINLQDCRSVQKTKGQLQKNLYRKFVVGLQVNLENQEPIYSKKIMQDIYLYDCRSVQKTKKQFIKKFYIVRCWSIKDCRTVGQSRKPWNNLKKTIYRKNVYRTVGQSRKPESN